MGPEEYIHTVQMICEIHRFPESGGNWHRTDAITLHGLDTGDRRVVLDAFGKCVNSKVASGMPRGAAICDGSLALEGVEHLDILNLLSVSRGFKSTFDAKVNNLPMPKGGTDMRYNLIYTLHKVQQRTETIDMF